MIELVVQVTAYIIDITVIPFQPGYALPTIHFGDQAFQVGDQNFFPPMYLPGMTLQTMIILKHLAANNIGLGISIGKSWIRA